MLRQHTLMIREKMKIKKFHIDKLYSLKQKKKLYKEHLINVKNII